jgi:hypothetical protein
MNPRDELRMLVLFYVGGVIGIAALKERLTEIVKREPDKRREQLMLSASMVLGVKGQEMQRAIEMETAAISLANNRAELMLAACKDYTAPIRGWNVGELADRDQILVNKLKAAVQ